MKTKLLFLFIVLLSFQVKAQWVAQSDRLLTGEVYSIKMRGDTVYLLSGWAFYTSTDRGKTFSEIDLGQDKNIQDEFIRHIAIDSKGNAYILFYKYKQGPTEIDSTKILVSSDAFKTYKEIYRIKGYPKCKIIVSPSDSILFIYNKTYNEYSTLISSDYGKTWKEYSNNIWSDYDHLYLKRIGNKLFTWTYSGEDDCRHIYVSTDNGKTYSAFGKPIPFGSIECLNINSKNHIYAGVTDNGVMYFFRSTDNGENWENLYSFSKWGWIYDIEFDRKGNIYIAGLDFIYCSKDEGATWQKIGDNRIAYSSDDDKIWSISNYCFSYYEGSGNAVDNMQITRNSIYPNPAKDYLYLKEKTKSSQVKIYDMAGRSFIFPVNNNVVDIRTLQKGSYIISIEDSKFKFIKK